MCRYAALAHGALRARDGVDSLRTEAVRIVKIEYFKGLWSNARSSCASAMGLPPSLTHPPRTSMAWRRPKN